jgi:RNA polymerase sigma-70 factor (ECF subfamily)
VDKKLIESFRKGDHEAFESILNHSLEPCLRLATRLIGSREEAEDIVQDCFVTVWEKRRNIKNVDSFFGWIRRIIVNRCYDFLRKKQRKIKYIRDSGAVGINSNPVSNEADRNLNLKDSDEILSFITSRLSPKQKVVFILSEIEELSSKEIEKLTGMTSYSIKSNCYHARKRAKEIYYSLEKI